MFSWLNPAQRPSVVAHRGASSETPENTLAAFRRAIEEKSDAVEIDIHLTRDGEVIVIHDDTLQRTTNGRGYVKDRTFKELRRLRAGAWFGEQYADEVIPTLDEVMELTGRKIGINIEIKCRYSRDQKFTVVDRCRGIIRSHKAEGQILISSFHHIFLRHLRTFDDQIALGILYHPLRHRLRSPLKLCKDLGGSYLILSGSSVKKSLVEQAHDESLFVGEYTINTHRRLLRSLRWSIDAIYSDMPGRIRSYVTRG